MSKMVTPIILLALKQFGFESIVVPSYASVVDWFREEKQIYLAVLPFRSFEDDVENLAWYSSVVDDSEQFEIFCNEDDLGCNEGLLNSYSEAQEDAIIRAIEILESRINSAE